MSEEYKGTEFYFVGGAVPPDSPSYIERKADNELYEQIIKGNFCYVLTSRQMGKSSLMARTWYRLKKQGLRSATVDLTGIGSDQEKSSAGVWYFGIANCIKEELEIEINLDNWWEDRQKLSALNRLIKFLEEVVLPQSNTTLAIFIDEIEKAIDLPFSDEFFAGIRACYNARATKPLYRNLVFVLLGCASPSDLIKNPFHTPFNIGKRIDLTDFTFNEARILSHPLGKDLKQKEGALKRILYWSGGHPYLTQKLCQLVTENLFEVHTDEDIDEVVIEHFISPGTNSDDPHLKNINNRLLYNKKHSRNLLKLYLRILKGDLIRDKPLSYIHIQLKLSGLVFSMENRQLAVRNRIYREVFTVKWVKEVIPTDIKGNTIITLLLLIFTSFMLFYFWFLPQSYIEKIKLAEQDVPISAYKKLKKIPFYNNIARELFAKYWDHRAFRSELEGNRDNALFYRLEALKTMDTTNRRQASSSLTGKGYENLLATYYQKRYMSINAVAFTLNEENMNSEKKMVIGSDDGEVQLWDVNNYPFLKTTMKYGDYVNILSVAFSPDGQRIVAGGTDGKAKLWNLDNPYPNKSTLNHGDERTNIWALAFSPDGKIVVTGGDNGVVHFWRADNGQHIGIPLMHNDSINAIAFSPNGKRIVTGSQDGTARLWWVDNCQPIGKPMNQEKILIPFLKRAEPPPNPVLHSVLKVTFSPDGKLVLTGSYNSTAQLWDADKGQPIGSTMKHIDAVVAVAFSPDGKRVLTGCKDKKARLWSIDGNKLIGIMEHDGPINSANFSPDGKYVVTGSDDGTVMLWSSDNGQPIVNPMKNREKVKYASFTPDNRWIVTVSPEGTVRLFKVPANPTIISKMEYEQRGINSIDSNVVGNYIVTSTVGDTVQLLGVENNKLIKIPMRLGDRFKTVALSRVDNYFMTGSDNSTAQVRDIATNQPIGTTMEHDAGVNSVAFSPDGKRIVTGSDDVTAQLWSFDKNQIGKIGNPMRHDRAVNSVAFSPDGKRIVTGSEDGKIRLWDGYNASLIGEPTLLGDSINTVVFSGDGKSVIIATTEWIYRFFMDGDMLKRQTGRLLPGKWSGIYRLLDNDGYKIQVALYNPPGFINIYSIRSDTLDEKQIEGDPVKIINEWEKKLGLRLKANGDFYIFTTNGKWDAWKK